MRHVVVFIFMGQIIISNASDNPSFINYALNSNQKCALKNMETGKVEYHPSKNEMNLHPYERPVKYSCEISVPIEDFNKSHKWCALSGMNVTGSNVYGCTFYIRNGYANFTIFDDSTIQDTFLNCLFLCEVKK